MNFIAVHEKIPPIGEGEKMFADGLEHYLGTIAKESTDDAIKVAKEIMSRRFHLENMSQCCKVIIAEVHRGQRRRHPKNFKRFLRTSETEKLLGDFF